MALAATPAFVLADTPPSEKSRRVGSVDGLRGYLALGVFFSHAAIYHDFLRTQAWGNGPSHFYSDLGPLAVSMFFMITGYLFWSKLIRDDGKPNWIGLFVGRIFRIGPLYLTAVLSMLAVVFAATGFKLNVALGQLVRQAGEWLTLGFIEGPDVNGYVHTSVLLARVTWSIRWEWMFYLSLPILAFASRGKRHLPFVASAFAVCIAVSAWRAEPGRPHIVLISAFLAGMLSASLQMHPKAIKIRETPASILVLLMLTATFYFQNPYSAGPVLLLGCVFYAITSGCTVFGLLVSRPAIRLGDVSYRIYLLQGLVLATVFRSSFVRGVTNSPVLNWSLTLIAGIVLIAVATAGHVVVERPGIELGKYVSSVIQERRKDRMVALKG